jgi:hypothetical protein
MHTTMSLSTYSPPPGHIHTTGEKAHQVEQRSEKQTAESEELSTGASFILNGSVDCEKDAKATEESSVQEPQIIVTYPKGVEILSIMLALVLSITLCSLDQVSPVALNCLNCSPVN